MFYLILNTYSTSLSLNRYYYLRVTVPQKKTDVKDNNRNGHQRSIFIRKCKIAVFDL